MYSSDARIAGQQRQLEDWADENLSWFFNKWRATRDNGDPDDSHPSGLRLLWGWLKAGGTWERPEISIVRGLGDRMDDLIGFLGSRRFFYSDTISMADLSVYSMLITMRRNFIPGSEKLMDERPSLVDYMSRVESETGGS